MNDSKYQKLHSKYISKMSSLKNQKDVTSIAENLKLGRTHVMKMKRLESSSFDMTWINEIEDAIFDLGNIVKNPRRNTKTVGEIVPIELARKTGAESVIHLSSHSNLIKEVKENGDIEPSKILNLASDDDFATYENRFVATVIRRLILFVEKRYDYVANYAKVSDAQVLYIKNKSVVDGMEVEIESKIRITTPSENNEKQSTDYIERIKEIRKYLRFYYNSDFMKKLKGERDVRTPILQTNIIRKNPEYNHMYRLFRFIESYDSIGVSYKVKETYADFSEQDFEEINSTLLANFLAINAEEPKARVKENTHQYKPKILKSIDDEEFAYGPLVRGPIQFVRMDEEYLNYMSKKTPLPPHMNNHDRIYYEDEIAANKEKVNDLYELQYLIRRKKADLKVWEQFVAYAMDLREKEAEKARRLAEIKRLEAEEALLRAARERLAKSAKYDIELPEIKEEPIIEPKPLKLEPKPKPIKKAPVKKAKPKVKKAKKVAPKKEEPKDIAIVEKTVYEEIKTPVVEPTPVIEPVKVEEPAPAPVVEEPKPVEEPAPAPVVEEPKTEKVEKPKAKKAPAKKKPATKKKVVKKPAVKKAAPKKEVAKAEEPKVVEPVKVEEPKPVEVPAPVVEEPKPVKKTPAKKKPAKKSVKKAPAKKPAVKKVEPKPVVVEPVKVEEPKPAPAPVKAKPNRKPAKKAKKPAYVSKPMKKFEPEPVVEKVYNFKNPPKMKLSKQKHKLRH